MTRTRFASLGSALFGLVVLGCAAPDGGNEPTTTKKSALTAVLFSPYVATPTGSAPQAVAIGDLNGDGRNDVAMTTASASDPANDNMLHVFLQAADGTLLPRVKYPLGKRPESLDIGDVNGDGRADVVVGNFDSSSIGVLLQNASGTLDQMVVYPTVNSLSVKIGDFNSDGRMDVVGINWGARDDGVDVFLQTVTGTLAPPVTYHVSHGGYDEVDVGDVNGDGRTDIVVMSGQLFIPNVGVLPQNADGTMGTPAYYSVGTNILTHGIGVGDMNGDGLSDIVVSYGGNRPGSFIGRFLQNGQHTLDPAVSYASYDIPSSVVLADVDADGRKDVLVTHSGWARLGVYRQTAAGDLGAEELYPITGSDQFQPQGLAVGDINGDGLPDAVIADSQSGLVVLQHVDDVPPTVAITAPTGGTYYPNVPIALGWTASDNAALAGFDLSVSLDGGTTFGPIPGCTGLPATARACSWTPSGPTTGVRLRVTARDKAGNQASADAVIDVALPTLTVTAPASGSAVFVGARLAISWTDNLPPSATVLVELSRDGGGSFQTLSTAAPNTGGFAWTATGPDAAAALVRVTASGPATASGTSGAFGIVTPVLTVTSPAPGAVAYVGAPAPIVWVDNLPPSAVVTVEVSRDGGASFELLAAAAPNTGAFAWAATGPDSPAALVRVTAIDSVVASGLGGPFGIVTPAVTVTGPPAGAVAYVGTAQAITWTDNLPADATMLVELSRNGGASFETLAAAAPNSGSFAWTATGPDCAAALARVTWNDPLASRGAGAAFAIVTPTLTVTSPAGGASWPIGTANTITWATNLPAGGTVRIDLTRDGGVSFETLAATAPQSGSFTWIATGPAAPSAVVRVTANGAVPASGSSGAIAIVTATLGITAPTTGASWTIGSTHAITWTTNLPATGTVRVELSRNGGSSYTSLATAAPQSGSFIWTVTGAATTSAVVRVSSNSTTATSTSGKFAVVAGSVTVTSPNTAVTWNVGSVHAITWTHNAGTGAQFKIEVSRNGGGTWSLVTAAAPGNGAATGSYNWTVSSPRTAAARIRVTWTANTAATDTSNVNFRIN